MTLSERKLPKLGTVVLALAGAIIVAVTLFRVPLATVFTLGVVLICPLLMIGMHGGHGAGHSDPGHHHTHPGDGSREAPEHIHTTAPRAQLFGLAPSTDHGTKERQP